MIVYALIFLGFVLRVVPHMPNFAPVAAIAVFAGAYLNKRVVPWVPLAIMMASDLVIGLHDVVLYTWGAFVVIGFIGMSLRGRVTTLRAAGTTIISSFVFFAITNFGVWLAWYPRTLQGFTECYIKAIPFLRNDVIGNLAWALILFGLYELARKLVTEPRSRAVLLAESL